MFKAIQSSLNPKLLQEGLVFKGISILNVRMISPCQHMERSSLLQSGGAAVCAAEALPVPAALLRSLAAGRLLQSGTTQEQTLTCQHINEFQSACLHSVS